jgi:hypothetical protein
MVVFWCPQVAQTLTRFPAVKQGANPGIVAERSTHLNELDVRKPFGISLTKKCLAETLQSGLEFDNFKPWINRGTYSNAFPGKTIIFWGNVGGSLKEAVRTYLTAQMSPS